MRMCLLYDENDLFLMGHVQHGFVKIQLIKIESNTLLGLIKKVHL